VPRQRYTGDAIGKVGQICRLPGLLTAVRKIRSTIPMKMFSASWQVCAVVLCLILVAPAQAGFKEGVAAHNRGDFKTALREFRLLAKKGQPDAQYRLGNMYANGEAGRYDFSRAFFWYRKAAEVGHVNAQFALGEMYTKGRRVPIDYVSAYLWFDLAAKGGLRRGEEHRDMAAKHLTPSRIAQAQELSREWWTRFTKRNAGNGAKK